MLADKRTTLARTRTITLIIAATVWLTLSAGAMISAAEGSASLATYMRFAVSMISIAGDESGAPGVRTQ
ncbi:MULTISPECIES: hypothetical protein [Rhodococcus]|uniref:Uncharacterized protein n=1 Tax=Rhodococcus wratislaviensis NBRC 100605 TaxID=1219028 RepID=X0PYI9_RHOWR|nr:MULTISPECIES: hypothetical protein [Rhodococcus]WAM15284.1 hypothetical protein OYT95_00990 [Rhodococcus sp. JS3073]GAF48654.1 hypothetical protein RW1_057_00240 [Rhodococcus wratislaviensis NBRC 100605]